MITFQLVQMIELLFGLFSVQRYLQESLESFVKSGLMLQLGHHLLHILLIVWRLAIQIIQYIVAIALSILQ